MHVGKEHFENGEPYIVIGDIPYELEYVSGNDDIRRFKTIEPTNQHHKQVFYNYFGESEISVAFARTNNIYRVARIDIRARKANAETAQNMINFISDNLDDMHMLCFSKSHTSGGIDPESKDVVNRLNLLKDAVSFIAEQQALFIKDHKYIWEHEMTLSEQGQPTGPDSVYYLLTHLDELSPTNSGQANVLVNGRAYRTSQTPQEQIVSNADVFENRVIYSFLYSALQYLINLKKTCESQASIGTSKHVTITDSSDEFVSFDHALKAHQSNILKHHIREIDAIQIQIKHIIHLYDKYIKVKLVPHLRPRFTAFVTARPHYRNAFEKIHLWHVSNAPDINENNFIMGLRSLSTIYEFCCLLLLNKVIVQFLEYKLISSSYCEYSPDQPYNGHETERPVMEMNNSFEYRKGEESLSIRYEPKIYQYREGISEPGDLINVAKKNRHHIYGEHFYCPDFVLKFNSVSWKEPLVIISDAKYQNRDNALKYSLPATEQKYLRDIFEVKSGGMIGISPIKLMLVLFAHGNDKVISRLNGIHQIGGSLPVYPQAMGLKLVPEDSTIKNLAKTLISIYCDHINYVNASDYITE